MKIQSINSKINFRSVKIKGRFSPAELLEINKAREIMQNTAHGKRLSLEKKDGKNILSMREIIRKPHIKSFSDSTEVSFISTENILNKLERIKIRLRLKKSIYLANNLSIEIRNGTWKPESRTVDVVGEFYRDKGAK